jgi:hypothetical protein
MPRKRWCWYIAHISPASTSSLATVLNDTPQSRSGRAHPNSLDQAAVRGLYLRNPMDDVDAPPEKRPPIKFYELDAVERIVGAQASEPLRVLFTLLYGTGIEISTALRLTRADVSLGTREIRAAGTKAHTRHRVAIVAEWAWPAIERYVRSMLPHAAVPAELARRWAEQGARGYREGEPLAGLPDALSPAPLGGDATPRGDAGGGRAGPTRPQHADAHADHLRAVHPDGGRPRLLGGADGGAREAPGRRKREGRRTGHTTDCGGPDWSVKLSLCSGWGSNPQGKNPNRF